MRTGKRLCKHEIESMLIIEEKPRKWFVYISIQQNMLCYKYYVAIVLMCVILTSLAEKVCTTPPGLTSKSSVLVLSAEARAAHNTTNSSRSFTHKFMWSSHAMMLYGWEICADVVMKSCQHCSCMFFIGWDSSVNRGVEHLVDWSWITTQFYNLQ